MIRLHGHEFILAGKARKPENNTHQVLNTIDKDALRIGMNCLMHASANAFFSIVVNDLLAWSAVPLQAIEISVIMRTKTLYYLLHMAAQRILLKHSHRLRGDQN